MRAIRKIPKIPKYVPTKAHNRENEVIAAKTEETSARVIVVTCIATVSPNPRPANSAAQSTPAPDEYLIVDALLIAPFNSYFL
jgi:hypothetical protein